MRDRVCLGRFGRQFVLLECVALCEGTRGNLYFSIRIRIRVRERCVIRVTLWGLRMLMVLVIVVWV